MWTRTQPNRNLRLNSHFTVALTSKFARISTESSVVVRLFRAGATDAAGADHHVVVANAYQRVLSVMKQVEPQERYLERRTSADGVGGAVPHPQPNHGPYRAFGADGVEGADPRRQQNHGG